MNYGPIRSTRWVRHSLAALLLAVVGAIGLPGTASAHTGLSSSDPANGATLTAPPSMVTLTFEQPMVNIGAAVVVTGPDGQQYPTGDPVVDSAEVRADLAGLGAAGTYTISYRVVSGDGHPVEGQVQFLLDVPAAAPSAPPVVGVPAPPPPDVSTSQPATSPSFPEPSRAISSISSPSAPVSASSPTTAGVAATASGESSGPSGWVWAAVVVVALLIATAAVAIIRQRRTGGQA